MRWNMKDNLVRVTCTSLSATKRSVRSMVGCDPCTHADRHPIIWKYGQGCHIATHASPLLDTPACNQTKEINHSNVNNYGSGFAEW